MTADELVIPLRPCLERHLSRSRRWADGLPAKSWPSSSALRNHQPSARPSADVHAVPLGIGQHRVVGHRRAVGEDPNGAVLEAVARDPRLRVFTGDGKIKTMPARHSRARLLLDVIARNRSPCGIWSLVPASNKAQGRIYIAGRRR